jgi:hypothetical protein
VPHWLNQGDRPDVRGQNAKKKKLVWEVVAVSRVREKSSADRSIATARCAAQFIDYK